VTLSCSRILSLSSTTTLRMSSTRKFFVGGNWKCNGGLSTVTKLVSELNKALPLPLSAQVVVAPPSIYLESVKKTIDPYYSVSAQNCWPKKGAFTGEIAPEFIKDFGLNWVILGHSERRNVFRETDEVIVEKTKAALAVGLDVIYCIGESLAEREGGKTNEVLERQLSCVCKGISSSDWSRIVIAYEPVWAIGTGKTATPAQAQDAHKFCRGFIAKATTPAIAAAVRILYGGSVSPSNCNELAALPDVDGFLVGGASLDAAKFVPIINSVSHKC
jgi:triosephosphate isomerase